MSNIGWIKIWRVILEDPMYLQLNSKQRDVMLVLLLMANHQKNEWLFNGELYICEAGQFITSLKNIKENCAKDVSNQNIRTVLNKLKKYKFLTNKSTNKNSLITICNWEKYQGELTNELTNNQQTTNKRLTTNKNDKNVNNNSNNINILLPERISDNFKKWLNLWEGSQGYPITKNLKKNETAIKNIVKVHGVERLKQALIYLTKARGQKGNKKIYWANFVSSYIKLDANWDNIQAYITTFEIESAQENEYKA